MFGKLTKWNTASSSYNLHYCHMSMKGYCWLLDEPELIFHWKVLWKLKEKMSAFHLLFTSNCLDSVDIRKYRSVSSSFSCFQLKLWKWRKFSKDSQNWADEKNDVKTLILRFDLEQESSTQNGKLGLKNAWFVNHFLVGGIPLGVQKLHWASRFESHTPKWRVLSKCPVLNASIV